MIEGVIVGFDFGLKRLGVAIGNTLTKEARPLQIIDSRTNQSRWTGIEKVLKEWNPSALVVGVPRHPDGTAHEMTARCERFARQLEGRFHLPVYPVDERYSSAVVDSEADFIDDEAACIILQQFFDESSYE
ncbi:MAG TPA: Holliday junction resolvase RuvX [Candidatus Aphodousia faecigallinarum]|uniref:Putative pre-16S rRNA nuclease n=1 Tax=Candidatus Aphodousia faecigallinarum TaxID=2840677 RepID=A0A9D1IJH4_9BURK|nr:Holliday junction resolvase RuvX [Candidatus Aphodousia faecigallinarum]